MLLRINVVTSRMIAFASSSWYCSMTGLALFDPDSGPLSDPHIYVTPRNIKYPALNIFDVNRGRLGQYDEAIQEQVTDGQIAYSWYVSWPSQRVRPEHPVK